MTFESRIESEATDPTDASKSKDFEWILVDFVKIS